MPGIIRINVQLNYVYPLIKAGRLDMGRLADDLAFAVERAIFADTGVRPSQCKRENLLTEGGTAPPLTVTNDPVRTVTLFYNFDRLSPEG
jgi:hypothetical protein